MFVSAPNAPKGLDPQKREMLEARFVGKVRWISIYRFRIVHWTCEMESIIKLYIFINASYTLCVVCGVCVEI